MPLKVPAAYMSRKFISSKPQSKSPLRIIDASADQNDAILRNQRLNRPIAPHLEVYKLDQTYFGTSAWMRITGCTLSGVANLYFLSYLVAPLFGASFDSAALVSSFQTLPVWAQTSFKTLMAFPFAYHSVNGVKQLMYDAGYMFTRKSIIAADRFLWISSFMASLGLVYLL